MTSLSGKSVIVLGLGRSGRAAVDLLRSQGALVTATDQLRIDQLAPEVNELDAVLVTGGHDGVDFAAADLVVVSPGVAPLPILADAERDGVEVIGELELASRYLSCPVVAVGGTNGKSTVTTLLATMLKEAGRRVFAGGNLGIPLSSAVGGSWDVAVVEVSSFQLERAPTFHPTVSILLNVTADHLDRYRCFEHYLATKGNAFARQRAGDVAIVPVGDSACLAQARRGQGKIVTFGIDGEFALVDDAIVENVSGERISLSGSRLHGRHNASNAAAAVAAARALGVAWEHIQASLIRFQPLAHRMTLVAEHEGIRYYDDSKGTNVGAAVTALLGIRENRAVLILGGRDKLGSYQPLAEALRSKGRAAVLIGEAADAIAQALENVVAFERASSMTEAVRRAQALAMPGDAIILSPACSSFDMFSGYAERGERFVQAVRSLTAASGGD